MLPQLRLSRDRLAEPRTLSLVSPDNTRPSMSTRYAPLPNPHTDPLLKYEMEAAFEEDKDEDDTNNEHAESRPLNPTSESYASSATRTPSPGI